MYDKPKCFTAAEWEQWQFWNSRLLDVSHKASTGCVDCVEAYKEDMLAQGRCADQRISPNTPDGQLPLPPEYSPYRAGNQKRSEQRRLFRLKERQALRLVNKGWTQVAAANEVGVQQNTVSKWVLKAKEKAEQGAT